MKWLSRLLSVLLAAALVTSAVAFVLDATIWSTTAMTKTADSSGLYEATAKALPEVLVSAATPGSKDLRAALTDELTPAFVRTKLEPLISELETYYRHNGAIPTLDLRDLQLRLVASNTPLPTTLANRLETPIPLSTTNLDNVFGGGSRLSAKLAWSAPLAAAVLAGLIVLLGRSRRWLVLAGGALVAAAATVAAALLAAAGPHLVASMLDTSPARPLTPAIRHLAELVAHDQTQQLLVFAGIFAACAVILGAVHLVFRLGERFRRKSHTA